MARSRAAYGLLAAVLGASACSGGDGADRDEASAARVALGVSSPYEPDRSLEERLVRLERETTGAPLGAVRLYHRWDESFPSVAERFLAGRSTVPVLSISTQRVDGSWIAWRDLATAAPGSPLSRQLEAWASSLDRWDGPLVVTLDHEPDFYRNGGDGEAADYIAAFRRFAEAVSAVDADVELAWIGVAYGFTAEAVAKAPDFYPGDDVVDLIGADGFNWAGCRDPEGRWRTFDEVFAPFRAWADERADKGIVLAEVGTVEDADDATRKATWLREAAASMGSEAWTRLRVVVFWDNVHEHDERCDFRLASSAASARAFASIAAQPLFTPTA